MEDGGGRREEGEIKSRNETNEGRIKKNWQEREKPKCGETKRDTHRSTEALVALLPRMHSDSGWLMTGSHGHSESERAGAALHTGAPPLIRGVHRGRMAPPRPPLWGCCCLQSHHPIISSLHYPSIIHSFILPHPQPSHHIHKDTLVTLRQRPQFILINSHEFNDFFSTNLTPF